MMRDYELGGMKIVSNPLLPNTHPKIQLNPKLSLNEDFKEKYNLWLKEFFGKELVVYIINPSIMKDAFHKAFGDMSTKTAEPMIAGNPMTLEILKESMRKLGL